MRSYLDCYPCFLRQALQAARMVGADENQQYNILQQTVELMRRFPRQGTPPEMAYRIHRMIRDQLGNGDPYRAAKEASTRQALEFYDQLKSVVAGADDPLRTAMSLSIAGNIIDLGFNHDYDLAGTIDRVQHEPFAIDHLDRFRQALADNGQLLYIGDNAGETVFDRILIETLPVPVTYVVRGGPIINDATYEDALAAGLDQVATIIDSGARVPGTLLHRCSPEFRKRFANAPIILAKGQGNYESLSQSGAPVFFALQAKCSVIAGDLGVPIGSFVLKSERN